MKIEQEKLVIPNSDVLSYTGPPWSVGSVLGLSIVSCPNPLAHVKTCNHMCMM